MSRLSTAKKKIRLIQKKLIRCSPLFWGSFRRLKPISKVFGLDRGQPIDRYYIENFLCQNGDSIVGVVMEISDATYTKQFGGSKVTFSDVLHVTGGNPEATRIGDLSTGENIPEAFYDCIILTQTLPFIFEYQQAIRNCYRALKIGGNLLVTVPCISQISRYDMDRWGDYWRFTDRSAKQLFSTVFGEINTHVSIYGNLLAAMALLQGISAEELKKSEIDVIDPDYQVTIGIRATKQ
jgi:hypothetical protein